MILALLAQLTLAQLMPMPAKVEPAPGKLTIDSSFDVAVTAYSNHRLRSAIARFKTRVSRQTAVPLIPSEAKPVLSIDCREGGAEYPSLGENESYQLDVSPAGAQLKSATVTGALRGLETFLQLLDGAQVSAVHIEDHPRFPWRGLMLDVSRHWIPVEVVKRNLDAMAAVKLNVFHWHLSDDQGFRVESRRFPKLQEFGSDGNFYTQAQVREVVEYARDRGIRVIPEFDVPGHTTSWLVGYPELASAPGPYTIERHWGVFQPTMDPTREETYRFLDEFIGEVAALFPDPYFHIGGDEVDETQWKGSKEIQAFEERHHLAGSHPLHAYFNGRLQDLLKKHGKIMIGWDEIFDPSLSHDTIIQSWRGAASMAEAARSGYRGVLSFGYYLDHLKPASFHYAVDPLNGVDPAQSTQILGGEACMWSEYVNADTVDSRIWPRLAAIAERFWSPREVTDVDSMYKRMESVRRELEWLGIEPRSMSAPMQVLADASEALGIDARRARKNTSLVPLNGFVDSVLPESESVRHLEKAVGRLELAELQVAFTEWELNDARLKPAGNLVQLSKNLSILGSIGLRTLEYLRTGTAPPRGWIAEQLKVVDGIDKPEAEVNLAAVRPVRMLLQALAKKGSSND